MTKVVYVTGCLGFIGRYVTQACLEKGWYVRGVDKVTYAANEKLIDWFQSNFPKTFTFQKADINDLEFIYECDYIINTAAETHVGNSIANSEQFVNSNVLGVHHLLELLRNYRQESSSVPTLLHFSTDEVYGDIVTGSHTESDPLKPSNPYSATKAAADMLVLAWARTYNLPYVIVRPTNNYGMGQYVEKLIPKACKFLKLGKKIPLHNNGTPVRSWLHAADTADAIIQIIEAGVKNEIYNVAGNLQQANYETVKRVIEHFKRKPVNARDYLDLSYSRAGQDVRYSLDDSKLRELGWKPRRIFEEELPKIVDYYKSVFIW